MTSTTTITTVDKKSAQWGVYVDVERNGSTVADAAKAHGYSGSGAAGAALESIRKAIGEGKAIRVDGVTVHSPDGTVSTDTSGTVKDRYEVADTIMENGGTFLISVDKLSDKAAILQRNADKLRTEATNLDAQADLIMDKVSTMRDQLASFGFDWDAFNAAMVVESTDAV